MIRARQITPAQDVTANRTGTSCTTHATPTGGGNAQSSPASSVYRGKALRLLWREVRSRPALFLAIAPLFEEVRRLLQASPGKRPQMASPVSSRLGLTACRLKETAPHRDLAPRNLPDELAVSPRAMELTLLRIGTISPGAGERTRPVSNAPPSPTGSGAARKVLFKLADAGPSVDGLLQQCGLLPDGNKIC